MSNKTTLALLASVGFNIFCVAFFLGRVSGPGLPPPPFFMHDHEHGYEHDHGFGGEGHFSHDGHEGMPPRPPMFTPDLLFTHEEMEKNMGDLKKNFDTVRKLGTEFADKLDKGPVSKEDVFKYLDSVDGHITDVRKIVRAKAADKITTMSEEDRKKLAARLRERCQEHGPDGASHGLDGASHGPDGGGHGPDGGPQAAPGDDHHPEE